MGLFKKKNHSDKYCIECDERRYNIIMHVLSRYKAGLYNLIETTTHVSLSMINQRIDTRTFNYIESAYHAYIENNDQDIDFIDSQQCHDLMLTRKAKSDDIKVAIKTYSAVYTFIQHNDYLNEISDVIDNDVLTDIIREIKISVNSSISSIDRNTSWLSQWRNDR